MFVELNTTNYLQNEYRVQIFNKSQYLEIIWYNLKYYWFKSFPNLVNLSGSYELCLESVLITVNSSCLCFRRRFLGNRDYRAPRPRFSPAMRYSEETPWWPFQRSSPSPSAWLSTSLPAASAVSVFRQMPIYYSNKVFRFNYYSYIIKLSWI